MKKHILIFLFLLFVPAKSALCASLPKEDIPPKLVPWIPWVMQGQEEQLCPAFCNNAKVFQCAWPSELRIQADKGGCSDSVTHHLRIPMILQWVTLRYTHPATATLCLNQTNPGSDNPIFSPLWENPARCQVLSWSGSGFPL